MTRQRYPAVSILRNDHRLVLRSNIRFCSNEIRSSYERFVNIAQLFPSTFSLGRDISHVLVAVRDFPRDHSTGLRLPANYAYMDSSGRPSLIPRIVGRHTLRSYDLLSCPNTLHVVQVRTPSQPLAYLKGERLGEVQTPP